jgi:hypothetical protein
VYRYSLGGKRIKANDVYWTAAPEDMTDDMEMIEGNADMFNSQAMDHTMMLTPDAGPEAALTGFPQSSHESFNHVENLLFQPFQHSDTLISQTLWGPVGVSASESTPQAATFEYPDPEDISDQRDNWWRGLTNIFDGGGTINPDVLFSTSATTTGNTSITNANFNSAVVMAETPPDTYTITETLPDIPDIPDIAGTDITPTNSVHDDATLDMLMEDMDDMEANAASASGLCARFDEDDYTKSQYFKIRRSVNDDFPIHPHLLLTLRHSSKKSACQQNRKVKIHLERMRDRIMYKQIGHRKWEASRVYQRSGLARSWTVESQEWLTWKGSKRVGDELVSAIRLGRGPKGDDPERRLRSDEFFL